MIDNIINYIGKKYDFLKSQGYCTLQKKDEIFIPLNKTTGKFIENFDKLGEFSYWRVINDVSIELVTEGIRPFYTITYPCKLVMVKKNEKSPDSQALNVINKLVSLNPTDRKELNIQNLVFNFQGYDIIRENVIQNEWGEGFKIAEPYNVLAFNINLVISIDHKCLDIC